MPSIHAVGPCWGISRPCLAGAELSGPLPAAQPLANSEQSLLFFFEVHWNENIVSIVIKIYEYEFIYTFLYILTKNQLTF